MLPPSTTRVCMLPAFTTVPCHAVLYWRNAATQLSYALHSVDIWVIRAYVFGNSLLCTCLPMSLVTRLQELLGGDMLGLHACLRI